MNDNEIVIVKDDGTEVVCEIIFTHEANGKNYVVFSMPGEEEITAAVYVPSENGEEGDLLDIETDEEWDMLDELLDQYFDDLEESDESEDEE